MIRVGTAGWSYRDWEGKVYPRKKPRGFHALSFLARFVSCVEINSTFYAPARPEHARRWLQAVEERPDFRFTAKLQENFTHHSLDVSPEDLRGRASVWLAAIDVLREAGRLAAVLVQFPFGFRASSVGEKHLAKLQEMFGHLPLVLEVRHRSWFRAGPQSVIRGLGYSLAQIDLPAAAEHPPMATGEDQDSERIGSIGYLRLHGRNAASWFDPKAGRDQRYDYLYSPQELKPLVQRARQLAGGGGDTYVITNNHFAGQALANALEISAELQDTPPLAPAELVVTYPRLENVVRVAGQPSLF